MGKMDFLRGHHIRCLNKLKTFPKATRKCLLRAFEEFRDGKLDFQPFYPEEGERSLQYAEACGFPIYLSVKGDRVAVIDVSLSSTSLDG